MDEKVRKSILFVVLFSLLISVKLVRVKAEDYSANTVFVPIVMKPRGNGVKNNLILGTQIELPLSTFRSPDAIVNNSAIKLSVRWSEVERIKGLYTWNLDFDTLVRSLNNNPLIIAVKGSPNWALNSEDLDWECKPFKPEFYSDYAKFIIEVINRYNPIAVEIWNEPENPHPPLANHTYTGCDWTPELYGNLLDTIYPIIKEAHPNVFILAGATIRPIGEDSIVSKTNSYDMLSIHAYGYWNEDQGMFVDYAVERINAAKQYSRGKPISITETALLCFDDCGVAFEAAQIEFLTWITNTYGEEIAIMIWYSLGDTKWRKSALAYDNVPKPVWFVFKNLVLGD